MRDWADPRERIAGIYQQLGILADIAERQGAAA